ncbi:hypothetical protein SAMN05216480_105108 [Pustulibacterium marinum]|uniref:Fibronectin type-III domain-containing protein n=1 Tax=Pustulibacterium marinum TaxID=1224947 RepID=A0A1I7GNP3_9FLAO|nr:hypothetical protein [Pustulibacterium marinum]SFU49886.1 hypothetical protein SAMN05216480_105108 [Pustulibacterium marinum]
MIYKVIINYSKLGDKALGQLAPDVLGKLTGNSHFTFAEGELTAFEEEINTYLSLLNTTGPKGVRINTDEKNGAKKKVEIRMNELAREVNAQGYNDLDVLLTSGFTMAKIPGDVDLGFPKSIYATQGNNAGTIDVSVPANNRKSFTNFYYTANLEESDVNKMESRTSTTTKIALTGLVSGSKYKIMAAYKGTDRYNKLYPTQYSQSIVVVAP